MYGNMLNVGRLEAVKMQVARLDLLFLSSLLFCTNKSLER
jgi:hypothetical protein